MLRKKRFFGKFNTLLCFFTLAILTLLMAGCISQRTSTEDIPVNAEAAAATDATIETINNDTAEAIDNSQEELPDSNNSTPKFTRSDCVPFDVENPFSYCNQPVCLYDKETDQINFSIHFNKIPRSDDMKLYLFEAATYEDDASFDCKPYVASAFIDNDVIFSFPYDTKHLFSRFVPAIVCDKEFHALSFGQYITNPEALAKNDTPYLEIKSKKGILLDPMTIDKDELNNLNVRRVIYNLPLSFIMGETDNDVHPTVDFEYLGETYHFNGFMLKGFDDLFSYLTANDYHVTVIVLNDWNEKFPDIIHPMSRAKTSRSLYYAFNTVDKDGVKLMEAAAMFLAERYSGGDYGLIQDWVIANEVNQQRIWNYMNTGDLELYTDSFEKSFRTFYNAIKSNYSNAKVYYSIDHEWNSNLGNNFHHFNAKDFLDTFNTIATVRGNYDWGVSIHPYPDPLTNTTFWYGSFDKTENARLVTPMNLTVLTDYMNKREFLDTKGNVRPIGVTELGFSSHAGEKAQAAAFAYCYRIIEDNEYINSFLMNRQTDSYLSLRSGLALGIYNPDYSTKYIADVFANIDTPQGKEYIPEMLSIIGAKSLDEALQRAK